MEPCKDTAIQIALKILTLMDDSHFNSLTITKVKGVWKTKHVIFIDIANKKLLGLFCSTLQT